MCVSFNCSAKFQNFLSGKFVTEDGSRTIKDHIINDTTGTSIIVTDNNVARNTVPALVVSEQRLYGVFTEFPVMV